jgi:hypothetical protein
MIQNQRAEFQIESPADELLTRKAAQRDDESRVAATLQTTLGDSEATGPIVRAPADRAAADDPPAGR